MSPRGPSRRAVLRGGTGAAVAAVAAGLTAAVGTLGSCSRGAQEPDELEGALAAARSDAALAGAAAGAHAELAARLGVVAGDRRAHADALDREIRRARPDREDALDAAPPAPAVPPSADGALAAVREALARASTDGRAVALGASGYRCGLLASVAANCGGHAAELA